MPTTPTYYIDPVNGSASNDGLTEATPKLALPGTLVANEVYGFKRGTTYTLSATSNITIANVSFVAYGSGEMPKIDCNGNTNPLLLNTTTANDFYAENIWFTGAATDTVCAVEIQAVNRARLNGCKIDCTGSGGIMINGGISCIIENCEILVTTNAKRGIYVLTSGVGNVIRNNKVKYFGATPNSSAQGIAMPVGAGITYVYDNRVEGWYTGIELESSNSHQVKRNVVANCLEEGIAMTDSDSNTIEENDIYNTRNTTTGSGISISATSQDNTIKRNLFRNNYQSYIDTSTGGGNDVFANLFVDATTNHISFQANSTNRAYIFNNTLKHSPTKAGHGFVVQGTLTNAYVDFKNNLIKCDFRNLNVQCVEISGTITNRLVFIDGNQYYTENGAHLAAYNNTNYETLEAFKSAISGDAQMTGKEVNSVFLDPGIFDWSNNPYPRNTIQGICYPLGGRFLDKNGNEFANPPFPGAFNKIPRQKSRLN